MPRSQSEIADLICPTCSQPFRSEVWLIIDRQERPDLTKLIMAGELNGAACPYCGAEGGINHPLLFHDGEREQVLVALPLTVQGPVAAHNLVGDLLQRLLNELPPEADKPYLGEVELLPELDGLRTLLIEQAFVHDQRVQNQLVALAIQDLLNVGDEHDFQRVIAQHRTRLLTDQAEQALDQICKNACYAQDRELQRRAQEARTILGRLRSIVISRRSALNILLDNLAPLSDEEIAVLPQLKQMLDAIDPQEVYAARISLTSEQQVIVDRLIERLAEQAGKQHQPEALAFLRNLALLPQQ